jgi:hypothetical protein
VRGWVEYNNGPRIIPTVLQFSAAVHTSMR